jgi:hypothetical protein
MHDLSARSGALDFDRPNRARLVDALLGGRDNYAVDRELVARLTELDPGVRQLARDHRDWVVRCLRLVVTAYGVDQFIDLDSGLPTVDNTHQIVQRHNSEARVVYVDGDPVVQAHGRALLEENELTHMAAGDFADPRAVLATAELVKNIDFERPICLMLCSAVHHILDDAEAAAVVYGWVDELPAGSYLMLTHGVDAGGEPGALARRLDHVFAGTDLATAYRSRERIAAFFTGLDLVEPGISPLHAWWPDGPRVRPLTPISYTVVGALARKP